MLDLDRLLDSADPTRLLASEVIESSSARVASVSSSSPRVTRRGARRRLLFGVGIGVAVVLTGGAAVALVTSSDLFVRDGVGSAGDVVVPVMHLMPSGTTIACTFNVQFGAQTGSGSYPLPENFAALLEEYNASQDWSDFDERVRGVDVEIGETLTAPGHASPLNDGSAWLASAGEVFRDTLPPALSSLPMSTTTTCVN